MSKTLKIKNKEFFVKNFLSPISKISDSAIFEIKDKHFSCLSCTADNSVIYHSKYPVDIESEDNDVLNLPDIKKMIRAIDAISSDDIDFTLENNNLTYKDKSIRFTYHLLEDGIIKKPRLNLQKLEDTEFETTFSLKGEQIRDLMKGAVFSSDSNKVYISSNEDGVYAELTDKTRKNIDTITLRLTDEFQGENISSLPINFEVFRLIESGNKDLNVKINSKLGIVIFEVSNNYNKTLYIVSSLVK